MTGQVGAEAESQPPRSRRARRPLLAVLIVLVAATLALGGTWWFRAAGTAPAAAGPEATVESGSTSTPPLGEPTVERPSTTQDSGQQSAAPLPPIPGTTADAVAAGWAKLWGTPPKPSARGYDTKATLPGTKYRTRFGILKSPAGDGSEVATLFCMTSDPHLTRDQRLIRAVVDSCLAPALRDEEKATLSTWLTEQDYSSDVYATRELPRFVADLVSADDVFHVGLYSKGRTAGPGAVPTTGAGPAG